MFNFELNTLIFVRHGWGEHNAALKNPSELTTEQINDVHNSADWAYRLTEKGKTQASEVGAWVRNLLDERQITLTSGYASCYSRTIETAKCMKLDIPWDITEHALVERNWGAYGGYPRGYAKERWPEIAKQFALDPWYTRLTGGESMDDVSARVARFLGALPKGSNQLIVTHADLMYASKALLEGTLPWEYKDQKQQHIEEIKNCTALVYYRDSHKNLVRVQKDLEEFGGKVYEKVINETPLVKDEMDLILKKINELRG